MEFFEIIAQIIGVIAMIFNILSYQCKSRQAIIALQLIGATLFAVNFLMLGATVGGILNILAVIRAAIYMFKDKFKADTIYWFVAFVASYILIYVLNFTAFGKEATPFNLIIEILPVIGMTALNVGYRLKNSRNIRTCGLISSPAWLIYNIIAGSFGAIICETFTIISILIGILRHDKKD